MSAGDLDLSFISEKARKGHNIGRWKTADDLDYSPRAKQAAADCVAKQAAKNKSGIAGMASVQDQGGIGQREGRVAAEFSTLQAHGRALCHGDASTRCAERGDDGILGIPAQRDIRV